jgi:ribose transport system substrate-binding protein
MDVYRQSRGWRRLCAVALALTTWSGLAACGGSSTTSQSTSGSANVTEAAKLTADAAKPLSTWQPAGASFDGSKARGKSIWYIGLLEFPFEQSVLQGLKDGAATVGATVTGFDEKSSLSEAARGMQQAVQAKADLIILDSFPPQLLAPGVAAAKQAGIPVITANTQDVGPALSGYPDGVVGSATHPFSTPGKIEADWIVADSKGKANIIYQRSSDLGVISDSLRDGFVTELHRLCANCKVQVVDVPTSQWSGLTTKTASLIRANPDVNYIVPDFDGQVTFMIPGVISANAQSRVKLVSFNATPANMQSLKNANVVAAETGGPNLLQGWAFAEASLRLFAGLPALPDLNIPTRLFDATNIKSIDLSAQESEWYGVGDYKAKYKKLWGAG